MVWAAILCQDDLPPVHKGVPTGVPGMQNGLGGSGAPARASICAQLSQAERQPLQSIHCRFTLLKVMQTCRSVPWNHRTVTVTTVWRVGVGRNGGVGSNAS